MIGAEEHDIAAVEPESDPALAAFALALHLDRSERRGFDVDVELLDGRHQHVAAVRFSAQHGREQANHRGPPDRCTLMVPGAVASDAHIGVTAALRVPFVDGRQSAFIAPLLEVREA